jgi:hypothetical protein
MVELMLAMVLTLMVGAVTYRILMTNQRVTRSQNEHVSMQDNVRSGALIIGSELREVGYDQLPNPLNAALTAVALVPGTVRSDIVAIGPDSVRYKAMRGFGVICNLNMASSELILQDNLTQSVRSIAVGDSILIYAEVTTSSAGDDTWLHAAVKQLPGAQNCPGAGGTGTRVKVEFTPAALVAAAVFPLITLGSPVRFYEEMLLRSYVSNGDAWLGVRNLNVSLTAIQPVLGPIANGAVSPQGLGLEFRDVNGNVTAVPANVRSVGITLRGVTDNAVHRNGQGYRKAVDTLAMTTVVALRNALR